MSFVTWKLRAQAREKLGSWRQDNSKCYNWSKEKLCPRNLSAFVEKSCQRLFVSYNICVTTKINQGCHRHSFPKFPDFYLMKTKFSWPKKCRISGLVAASSSTRSLGAIMFNKSPFLVEEKYCGDQNDSECFFQSSTVLNRPHWIISIFLTFPCPWRTFFPGHSLWQLCSCFAEFNSFTHSSYIVHYDQRKFKWQQNLERTPGL